LGETCARQAEHPDELRIGLANAVACTRQGQTLDCKSWASLLSAAKGVGLHTASKV